MVFERMKTRRKFNTLIRHWVEFQAYWMRFRGAEDLPDVEEARFLALKARIAALLPLLTESAPSALSQEAVQHQRAMTDLMNINRTLRAETPPTEREHEEFNRRWHAHFLFLNQLQGAGLETPRAARTRRASVSKVGRPAPTGMPVYRRKHGAIRGFISFVGSLVLFAVFVYVMLLVIGSRLEGGRVLGLAGKERLGGLGAIASDLWQKAPATLTGVLAPVRSAYGTELTIALLCILLLSVGYWFFIRVR
jgi:hypothetical protein